MKSKHLMDTLVVKDIIGSTLASTPNKAKPFLDKLCKAIDSRKPTVINFSGLNKITPAFLNSSIGKLYSLYDANKVNEYINLESSSLTLFQKEKVLMVMHNTKQKLSPNQLEKEID